MIAERHREQLEVLGERRRTLATEATELDAKLCEAVHQSRDAGASLAEVADALGVSRPAVDKMHKRAASAAEAGR